MQPPVRDEMDQVEAVPVVNKEKDAALRREINEVLLKHLDGSTTIAEMLMIGDRVFNVVDSWNRNGNLGG
jgi:hypothetical protein